MHARQRCFTQSSLRLCYLALVTQALPVHYIFKDGVISKCFRLVPPSKKMNQKKSLLKKSMGIKVQWAVLTTLQVKSQSGRCNEIWILRPFSKAAEKTQSCFALDTEHQYWTVTVQHLCRVKKISMTSNVLPLHFAPSQASSSQRLNVDNF